MRDLLGNMITGDRKRILRKNISNEYTISITHDNMDYLEELSEGYNVSVPVILNKIIARHMLLRDAGDVVSEEG